MELTLFRYSLLPVVAAAGLLSLSSDTYGPTTQRLVTVTVPLSSFVTSTGQKSTLSLTGNRSFTMTQSAVSSQPSSTTVGADESKKTCTSLELLPPSVTSDMETFPTIRPDDPLESFPTFHPDPIETFPTFSPDPTESFPTFGPDPTESFPTFGPDPTESFPTFSPDPTESFPTFGPDPTESFPTFVPDPITSTKSYRTYPSLTKTRPGDPKTLSSRSTSTTSYTSHPTWTISYEYQPPSNISTNVYTECPATTTTKGKAVPYRPSGDNSWNKSNVHRGEEHTATCD